MLIYSVPRKYLLGESSVTLHVMTNVRSSRFLSGRRSLRSARNVIHLHIASPLHGSGLSSLIPSLRPRTRAIGSFRKDFLEILELWQKCELLHPRENDCKSSVTIRGSPGFLRANERPGKKSHKMGSAHHHFYKRYPPLILQIAQVKQVNSSNYLWPCSELLEICHVCARP